MIIYYKVSDDDYRAVDCNATDPCIMPRHFKDADIQGEDIQTALASGDAVIKPYSDFKHSWKEKRCMDKASGEYGSIQEQLEILGEQGIDAYMSHIAAVKKTHPKP